MIEVILFPKALAAILILRFDLHTAVSAVVNDEGIHISFPPWTAR
jgi:hypothetical protein